LGRIGGGRREATTTLKIWPKKKPERGTKGCGGILRNEGGVCPGDHTRKKTKGDRFGRRVGQESKLHSGWLHPSARAMIGQKAAQATVPEGKKRNGGPCGGNLVSGVIFWVEAGGRESKGWLGKRSSTKIDQ